MVAGGADGEPPPAKVAGVVAICYPLHPPGKPEQPARRAPAGDHRAVPVRQRHQGPVRHARRAEQWTATIAGPVTHHWIDGGRHDLRGEDAEVAEPSRLARPT